MFIHVHLLTNSTNFTTTVRFWFPSAFLLCLFAKVVGAVDLDKCKANFQNETGQTQFTYKQCLETCGGGAGVFKWKMFSDDFSTWLLPWIALMFQLPFGASGMRFLMPSNTGKRS